MAELLVLAQDRVTYRKGDIIEIRANGENHAEGLPNFVIVKVPDLLISEGDQFQVSWKRELQFLLLSTNPDTDSFSFNISSKTGGISGRGDISRADVEQFLNSWNIAVLSSAKNSVVVEFSIFQLATSNAFWGRDVSQIAFSEVSYDKATGIHQIRADYSALPVSTTGVERQVMQKGGTVVSHDAKAIVFDLHRDIPIAEIKREIAEKSDRVIERRRFYFDVADVDLAIAAGGVIQISKSLFLTKVKDKLNNIL